MRFIDRRHHVVFGHLAGEALDHQHVFVIARDDQVEIAFLELVLRGKRHELTVDLSQSHRGKRSLKWQAAKLYRRGGPGHGQDVGVVLPVAGDDEGLNLYFVVESFREEGADGPVHQPCGKDLFGRGAAFAFEEPARKLSRGRGSFAVVASQREEVDARSRRAAGDRTQHDGVAVLHETTSGRLFGEYAGFDGQRRITDLLFNTYFQCSIPTPFCKSRLCLHQLRAAAKILAASVGGPR